MVGYPAFSVSRDVIFIMLAVTFPALKCRQDPLPPHISSSALINPEPCNKTTGEPLLPDPLSPDSIF